MKKATLIAGALVCAFVIAGTASAQTKTVVQPPRTPVAGYSPKLAYPQPATRAILSPDANRLIRWQGWLKVDAFSISVLEQMQKQLGNSIEVGTFTIAEPAIADAVRKAIIQDHAFLVNENLSLDQGEYLSGPLTLYIWTYRHNYSDSGLYQLYVSVKGQVLIGQKVTRIPPQTQHWDIQSLGYEFGGTWVEDVYADVEIWRGAIVRVNAKGEITMVGNEAGAIPLVGSAEGAPMSEWEVAPSLRGNPNFSPRAALGAGVVAPLDRAIRIPENSVQKATGRYVPPMIIYKPRVHGR